MFFVDQLQDANLEVDICEDGNSQCCDAHYTSGVKDQEGYVSMMTTACVTGNSQAAMDAACARANAAIFRTVMFMEAGF